MGLTNEAKIVLDDVEVDAGKVLTFLSKVQKAEPAVIAGLAVLLGKVGAAVTNVQGAAAAPLNIQLDEATVASVKAVWPAMEVFLATLGIKV